MSWATNGDIVREMMEYSVVNPVYIHMGTVSRQWRRSYEDWGTVTSLVRVDTSVAQLQACLDIPSTPRGDICLLAADRGRLDLLVCARDNGCPWDSSVMARGARGGHLDLVRWAHENGCPWDEDTTASAATNGHLSLLQWVRSMGCPWDWGCCFEAWLNGHAECLRWARENGAPYTKDDEGVTWIV